MLEYGTFNDLVGSTVTAASPTHGPVALQVVEAKQAAGDRPDNAFSVLFKGAVEVFLEQMSYELNLGEIGTHLIFLVPVMEELDGYVYEAVFTALKET